MSWVLADMVAPIKCLMCSTPSDGELCARCAEDLEPILTPVCLRCGVPAPKGAGDQGCRVCTELAGFHRARSLLLYQGPAGRLILALKRRGRRELAQAAGRLMADLCRAYRLGGDSPTIVYVPAGREADARGYDHAELIARAVGEALERPVRSWLRRTGGGRRQSEVALHERRSNAARRFRSTAARGDVLLVDDVFTTGATVEACAGALMEAGARLVDVVTLARTPRLRPM